MKKSNHFKSKEDLDIEKEQSELKKKKRPPKRFKAKPIDRDKVLDEDNIEKLSDQHPFTKDEKKASIKKIVLALVIILVCALGVFAYANKDNFSFDKVSEWFTYDVLGKSRGEGYPVNIVGSNLDEGNIGFIDGYLCYVSDTASIALKSDGNEVYNRQIRYSSPIQATEGEYSIICNLNGTGFEIHKTSAVIYTGESTEKIFTADINSSGTYAIITQADGYLSKLYVYDKTNKLIFKYSFSKYYVYSIDISADGKKAVVGGISTENGAEQSAIFNLDFSSQDSVTPITFDNSLLYGVKYITGSTCAVICDDNIIFYNTATSEKNISDYNGRVLTEYAVNKDTGCVALALSRSGDGRNCDILYYNSLGQLENTISTDLKISSIDLYKNKIGIIADGHGYIFEKTGTQIESFTAGNDAKVIKFASDTEVYVIGISEIRLFDYRDYSAETGTSEESTQQ